MALKDKASKIDLTRINDTSINRTPLSQSKTAIGMHAEAIFRDEKIAIENSMLKVKLAEFDGANATKKINPQNIKLSKWANRHEETYHNEDFQRFKNEIESANGNIQPIKVRPIIDQLGYYELIFGHRRLRACLELGIDVLALIEEMSDADLFCQMDRENRERVKLSPYETGVMYAKALDQGLFPSARKLSEMAGIDLSQLGKALALARLPEDVINAFESPLVLQYRWVTELNQALQKNPDGVILQAKALQQELPKLHPKQVLLRLIKGGVEPFHPPKISTVLIKGSGGQLGEIKLDSVNRTVVVNLKNFDPARFVEIEKITKELLSS